MLLLKYNTNEFISLQRLLVVEHTSTLTFSKKDLGLVLTKKMKWTALWLELTSCLRWMLLIACFTCVLFISAELDRINRLSFEFVLLLLFQIDNNK